ncbi:MAG: hypothetical protein DA328_04320 [Nitrososphaeraceae archaeon]|nr:hypothetical protein [Nitrososphaeraceae archaeon]
MISIILKIELPYYSNIFSTCTFRILSLRNTGQYPFEMKKEVLCVCLEVDATLAFFHKELKVNKYINLLLMRRSSRSIGNAVILDYNLRNVS